MWTGVRFGKNESFGDLWLVLALDNALPGMPATRAAIAAGIVEPMLPWGSMATTATPIGRALAYLTQRLEQARAPHPSPQVIDAIGRTLELSEPERAHLSRLAGHAPPAPCGPAEQIPPGVLALLDRLGPVAAYVCDARHDILAWNDLAAALITDFGALPPAERNVLRLAMRLGATVCSAPPEAAGAFEAQAAAHSREALTRRPHDSALRRLVGEFAERAPGFAAQWRRHDVRPRATLRKRLDHDELGVLDLDGQTLAVPGADLRVVLLSAEAGTLAHDKLTRLQLRLTAPEPSPRP